MGLSEEEYFWRLGMETGAGRQTKSFGPPFSKGGRKLSVGSPWPFAETLNKQQTDAKEESVEKAPKQRNAWGGGPKQRNAWGGGEFQRGNSLWSLRGRCKEGGSRNTPSFASFAHFSTHGKVGARAAGAQKNKFHNFVE